MIIPDLHAIEQRQELDGNGSIALKLFVTKRISTVDLRSEPVFHIQSALKASIYNRNAVDIGSGSITQYMNYPAIFNFQKSLTTGVQSEAQGFRLHSYSPITVNSSITTSRSDSTDKQLTSSIGQSVGSSTSQTNSFGVNVQGGLMMDLPMFSVGVSYDHAFSRQNSHDSSTSSGSASTHGQGIQDGFSIKDWGIYAKVDRENLKAGWVCGQEYPWDIMQFRSLNAAGSIDLPQAIVDRMLMDDCVLPPSQLSQFGTDFTFTAEWSFKPSGAFPDVDATVFTLTVDTRYALASHQRLGQAGEYTISATLGGAVSDQLSLPVSWWQMECLALNPLIASRNDAAINFTKLADSCFGGSDSSVLVASPTNTLICKGKGFAPGMLADVTSGSASYTLAFKVTDTVGDLSLLLRHWKLDDAPLALTVNVNGIDLPQEIVDSRQGNGATANRTDIILRTSDYMDENFCEYVQVGMNTVTVAVKALSPPVATQKAVYCLAAALVA